MVGDGVTAGEVRAVGDGMVGVTPVTPGLDDVVLGRPSAMK